MSGAAFGLVPTPPPFALLIRPNCAECAGPIRWVWARDLAAQVPPDARRWAMEGAEYVGPRGYAWICTRCGHAGVMLDDETDAGR